MHYQPSPQLDAKSSFYIDVYDIVHLVQSLLDPVLVRPDAGLYLPDQLEPVLKQGTQYWYEKPVFMSAETPKSHLDMSSGAMANYGAGKLLAVYGQPWHYYNYDYIPVTAFEQVSQSPWDVVDINPLLDSRPKRVILPHHLAGLVNSTPNLPVVALKLVRHILHNEIEATRAFNPRRTVLLEETILPFIQTQYQQLEHIRQDRWFQDSLSMVYDNLLPLMAAVKNTLQANPYQMYVAYNHDNFQMRIDQLGDYRILEWERITRDPEYQRWVSARSNGQWDRYVGVQEEITANAYAFVDTVNPYR